MDGEGNWTWIWRRDGVMAGTTRIQFGLIDQGGPSVESGGWAEIRSSVYRLAREVFGLEIRRIGDLVVLSGSVASETVKSRVGLMFGRMVPKLRNEIEVTAPFASASVGREQPMATGVRASEGVTSVSRHPSITPRTEARAGQPFRFDVDLAATPDGQTLGKAVELVDLPDGWSNVRMGVEVFCNEIVFDDTRDQVGTVTVSKDGSSVAATFDGRIRGEVLPGASFRLKVLFDQDGRVAGSASRQITVAALQVDDPTPVSSATLASPAGTVELRAEVAPATLTITIIADSEPGSFHWRVSTPRGVRCDAPVCRDRIVLGADTRGYAREILRKCPNLRPGQRHASELRGIGEQIWEATPLAFKGFYADMRTRYGPDFPIQIITEEHYVPWELMHPLECATIPDPDHLCMTHPVSRWFGGEQARMHAEFPAGRIASFVPRYADDSSLPAALEEGRRLVDEFGADAHDATYAGFTGFWVKPLPTDRIAVLHFAGHAASPLDGSGGGREGLRMLDDWVSSNEVHSAVSLGSRDGTFVILNACCAGSADEMLGAVAGWPTSLAARNFGGVLAPLWAVQDDHASAVVVDHVRGMIKGKMLGEAMRDARAFHRHASGTPYAYLCHGDVMARMGR